MAKRAGWTARRSPTAPARPRTPPSPTWPWPPTAGQIKTGAPARSRSGRQVQPAAAHRGAARRGGVVSRSCRVLQPEALVGRAAAGRETPAAARTYKLMASRSPAPSRRAAAKDRAAQSVARREPAAASARAPDARGTPLAAARTRRSALGAPHGAPATRHLSPSVCAAAAPPPALRSSFARCGSWRSRCCWSRRPSTSRRCAPSSPSRTATTARSPRSPKPRRERGLHVQIERDAHARLHHPAGPRAVPARAGRGCRPSSSRVCRGPSRSHARASGATLPVALAARPAGGPLAHPQAVTPPPARPSAARDRDCVAAQLGRTPHPFRRVVARCPWGAPAVVEDLPYDAAGRPFPTLFWATCPALVAAVSALESGGGVRRFAALAAADHGAAPFARLGDRLRAPPPAAPCGALPGAGPRRRRLAGDRRRRREPPRGAQVPAPARGPRPRAAGLPAGRASPRGRRPSVRRHGLLHADLRAGEPRVKVAVAGGQQLVTSRCRHQLGAPAARRRDGRVGDVARKTTVTRLGAGVDRRRRLDAAAAGRTRACVEGYGRTIAAFAPEAGLLVATSVLRDAADGAAFLDGLAALAGVPARVLMARRRRGCRSPAPRDGAPAERGAARESARDRATAGGRTLERPAVVVVDIGGGSVELAVGPPPPAAAPLLCLQPRPGRRASDRRFFAADPPTTPRRAARLRGADAGGAVPAGARTVGAGSAWPARSPPWSPTSSRCAPTPEPWSTATADPRRHRGRGRLSGADERRRGRLAGIQPGREDVILAGVLLACEVCRLFGLDVVQVSESDLLDGAALSLTGD